MKCIYTSVLELREAAAWSSISGICIQQFSHINSQRLILIKEKKSQVIFAGIRWRKKKNKKKLSAGGHLPVCKTINNDYNKLNLMSKP